MTPEQEARIQAEQTALVEGAKTRAQEFAKQDAAIEARQERLDRTLANPEVRRLISENPNVEAGIVAGIMGDLDESVFIDDPNAGIPHTEIDTFTDERGVVTAIHVPTGALLWQHDIGRPGSTTPPVVQPVLNPLTGFQVATRIVDRDAQTITYLDNEGNEVDPSTLPLQTPADPLDLSTDRIISEVFGEDLSPETLDQLRRFYENLPPEVRNPPEE